MLNLYLLLQSSPTTYSIDWMKVIEYTLFIGLGTSIKSLFDYFTTKKKIIADANQTDAGTNQILNNMVQVSSDKIKEWMQLALESAKKIVELERKISELEIENNRTEENKRLLIEEVEQLKELLNKSLTMIRQANLEGYTEFEREMREIFN